MFCQGIGAGFGAVWTCLDSDIVGIDPETAELGAPIAAGKAAEQGHLATGFDRVWVLTGDGSTLAGIDPQAGTVAEEIALDARYTDVAVDGTSVWLACSHDDVVLRVNPTTESVADRIDVVEPRGIAFSSGAVWVGAASMVARVDPATMVVVATIDGGTGRVGGIDADDTGVWVRRAGAPLIRIDPVTNDVTDELDLGVLSGGDVLVAHGAAWTTAYDDAALFRIELNSTRGRGAQAHPRGA